MQRIESFSIDHTKLLPGIYVSRKDNIKGAVITTFDIRVTRPNFEPVLNNAEIHTVEHLGATYLRNDPEFKDRIVYFGPMGCRTGFYLLIGDDLTSAEIAPLVTKMFEFVAHFEGELPGAHPEECGNYLDHNVEMAKYISKRYLENTLYNLSEENLN